MNLIPVILQQDISFPFTGEFSTSLLRFNYAFKCSAAAAKSRQSCPTLQPHRRQPTRLPSWGSPGKNTGVGCHFLLQCMRVKSESEVTQSCLTLSDPMDCSLPGFIHGISQARVPEWIAIAFSAFKCCSRIKLWPRNWLFKTVIDYFKRLFWNIRRYFLYEINT